MRETGLKPLVLLDIDDTLITADSDLLHLHAILKNKKTPVATIEAIRKRIDLSPQAVGLLESMVGRVSHRLVEPSIPEAIQILRREGAEVEGLTARPLWAKDRTTTQLAHVGIAMDVYFTGGRAKGEMIEDILAVHPDCGAVAFADDSVGQLRSVAEKVKELKLAFLSYFSTAVGRSFDISSLDYSRIQTQLDHLMATGKLVPDEDWKNGVR
jgi:hypothetical protein